MDKHNENKNNAVISVNGLAKVFRKKTSKKDFFTLKGYLLRRKELAFSEVSDERNLAALKDISFSVNEGDTFGIIGRNGSGKSTLLKLIAGIMKPTRGRITTKGRIATLIELGAGFHPEFTGRENLFINANILGIPMNKVKRIYNDIVEFSGIGEFINNPVKTYSSGMYMRLAFSIAIHVDPDILLVDEVLAVGDEIFQHKCKNVINDFRKRGKTIVMVVHDMETIKRMCNRAIYLEDGKVLSWGKPEKVIQRYMEEVRSIEEHDMSEHEVEEKRAVTELSDFEWGRKEVEILSARITGRDSMEKHVIVTGEPAIIEIRYRVNKAVESVVFGVAIKRDDGTLCFGTNTKTDGVKIPDIKKRGKVIIDIESLSLLPGVYSLDVAVHPPAGADYDYRSNIYSFVMNSSIRDVGVYRPKHTWKVYPQA